MIKKALFSEFVILFEIWESSVKATHDFLDATDFEAIKDLVIPEGFTMVDLFVYKSVPKTIEGFLGIKDYKIEMLFIKPDSIGQGIGKKLLGFAVNECKCNFVSVNEQNTRALEFYERFGFRVISRTEKDPMGLPYPILQMEYSQHNTI